MAGLLTVERLRELLRYDPDIGVFAWLVRSANARHVGDIAGTNHKRGYRVIGVDKRYYYAHRLAWFYMTGEWPKRQLDHVNGQRDDNRWCNLRAATPQQNSANRPARSDSGTGCKGVSRVRDKWRARFEFNKKRVHLGYFETQAQAINAYNDTAAKFHAEFMRAA